MTKKTKLIAGGIGAVLLATVLGSVEEIPQEQASTAAPAESVVEEASGLVAPTPEATEVVEEAIEPARDADVVETPESVVTEVDSSGALEPVVETLTPPAASFREPDPIEEEPEPAPAPTPTPTPVSSSYTCDCSKTCGQMLSCNEAYYQLNSCGCYKRDSDGDGVPCESLCQ